MKNIPVGLRAYRNKYDFDMDVSIGIDNGPTGSVGILTRDGRSHYEPMPSFTMRDYTKKKQTIERIDRVKLRAILYQYFKPKDDVFCNIERPMINPKMFRASIIAARAFESVLLTVEELGIKYDVIDSRIWQNKLLPKGTQGETALKQESFNLGLKLYPGLAEGIIKQNDADGLLIAHYAMYAEEY